MIKLYTSLDYFNKNNVLYDNESFFKEMISSKELTDDELDVLWKIDKAKVVNAKLNKIETPYGICSLSDISTGCKTAINVMFIMKHREQFNRLEAINATECGVNALESIFQVIDKYNYDINIVVEHDDDIWECGKRDYLINGNRHINDLLYL